MNTDLPEVSAPLQVPWWRWFITHPLTPKKTEGGDYITPLINLAFWVLVPGSLLFLLTRRR